MSFYKLLLHFVLFGLDFNTIAHPIIISTERPFFVVMKFIFIKYVLYKDKSRSQPIIQIVYVVRFTFKF